jgi:hypothetical protein
VVDLILSQRIGGIPKCRKDRILKPPLLECRSGPTKARNPGGWIEFKDGLFQVVFTVPLRRPESSTAIGSTNLDQRVDYAHDRCASENRVTVLLRAALPSVMDE